MKPKVKYVGYKKDEAEKTAERVEKRGGIAWLEDDYTRNMSGHEEWMGYQMRYFTFGQLKKHIAKHGEGRFHG